MLLLHNCDLAIVMNHKVMSIHRISAMQPQRGHDPQIEGSRARVNVLLGREGSFTLRRVELRIEMTKEM